MNIKALKDRNKAILTSTLVSLLFGFVAARILFRFDVLDSSWSVVIATIIFALVNPVIGKMFVSVGLLLCNAVDEVFQLPKIDRGYGHALYGHRWGGWPSNTQIVLAAVWPLTGLPIVVIALIALIFGLLFQSLFKPSDEPDGQIDSDDSAIRSTGRIFHQTAAPRRKKGSAKR